MVHYYFNNVHVKHTWEEFVQALRKIEEYECADKIVREKRLEGIVHPRLSDCVLFIYIQTIITQIYGLSVPFTNARLYGNCCCCFPISAHPVTVHPPSANGDPPTGVPTEPIHVHVEDLGSGYPVKV